MAQDYDNTNRGVMFKNSRKNIEKHPDYTGNLDVEGVQYWVSGWIKKSGPNSKNPGDKFLSLTITKKGDQPETQNKPGTSTGGNFDDFDDDIPFNRVLPH